MIRQLYATRLVQIDFFAISYVQLLSQLFYLRFGMESQVMLGISEGERESNPVFRVVYNKIRNLNKKLSQIHHIESLDRKALKTAQINKMAKKHEILGEIAHQEDFAARYKSIIVEHNLVYDQVDDLIKIASLLTVGKRIQTADFCPEQTNAVFGQIYSKIHSQDASQDQLSEEIVRVYRLLDSYLSNHLYYTQTQDYLTYQEEFDQKCQKREKNAQKSQENRHASEDLNKIDLVLREEKSKLKSEMKPRKLILESEVVKVQKLPASVLNEPAQIDVGFDRKLSVGSTNPDSEEAKADLEEIELISAEVTDLIEKDSKHDFSKKEEIITFESTSLRQSKKRPRKNKKRQNIMNVENVRKCSDTSLEPTPEKCKVKKPKYVEKVVA